jgi:hypothetical protein
MVFTEPILSFKKKVCFYDILKEIKVIYGAKN